MEHLIVPENYEPAIGLRETQVAIKIIKETMLTIRRRLI